jgi:hypothetical protein
VWECLPGPSRTLAVDRELCAVVRSPRALTDFAGGLPRRISSSTVIVVRGDLTVARQQRGGVGGPHPEVNAHRPRRSRPGATSCRPYFSRAGENPLPRRTNTTEGQEHRSLGGEDQQPHRLHVHRIQRRRAAYASRVWPRTKEIPAGEGQLMAAVGSKLGDGEGVAREPRHYLMQSGHPRSENEKVVGPSKATTSWSSPTSAKGRVVQAGRPHHPRAPARAPAAASSEFRRHGVRFFSSRSDKRTQRGSGSASPCTCSARGVTTSLSQSNAPSPGFATAAASSSAPTAATTSTKASSPSPAASSADDGWRPR